MWLLEKHQSAFTVMDDSNCISKNKSRSVPDTLQLQIHPLLKVLGFISQLLRNAPASSSATAKAIYPREFPVSEPAGLWVSLPAWNESRTEVRSVDPFCFQRLWLCCAMALC